MFHNFVLLNFLLIAGALCGCTPKQSSQPTADRISSLESRVEDLKPGLGEIMSMIQQHHAKLYYAGSEENWELADYQLDEIKEGLEDAKKYHVQFKSVKTPLNQLIPTMMNSSLDSMNAAIQHKSKTEFMSKFRALTVSCNKCHEAAEHKFIVIQLPVHPEFTNQKFSK